VPCKAVLVPDACSLLFSAQVELKGKTVFERLLEQYIVHVCTTVKYECFEQIQKGRVTLDDPSEFKREISRKEYRENGIMPCLDYLDEYCKENGLPTFSKLGDGERIALALSLYLSASLRMPIVFLCDDFGATGPIERILAEQKFAIQKSVPDVIMDIFRTDQSVAENQANGALNTYYNVMTRAAVHSRFKNRMKYNCRNYWEEKCAVMCSTF